MPQNLTAPITVGESYTYTDPDTRILIKATDTPGTFAVPATTDKVITITNAAFTTTTVVNQAVARNTGLPSLLTDSTGTIGVKYSYAFQLNYTTDAGLVGEAPSIEEYRVTFTTTNVDKVNSVNLNFVPPLTQITTASVTMHDGYAEIKFSTPTFNIKAAADVSVKVPIAK